MSSEERPEGFSRRHFFREGARRVLRVATDRAEQAGKAIRERMRETGAADHAAGKARKPLPSFVRPPGAIEELAFLDKCTRCNDCVMACPEHVIKKVAPQFGEAIADSPVLYPSLNACKMCKDLPCISACGEGALLPVDQLADVDMGTAVVDLDLCYSAKGSICEVCAERCPLRPRAFKVSFGEAPVLDEDACTGCGLCAFYCPPKAIQIEPSRRIAGAPGAGG
jgi:ferredoxin-type protein NapG